VPTFVAAGQMHEARTDFTATLLRNGKVLIAGGAPDSSNGGVGVIGSAELYDPTTGRFTMTGSLVAARAFHTATLLKDGRVLIAGGYGSLNVKTCSPDGATDSTGGGPLASAELYDPTTGKFTRTGSMIAARDGATAALLPDERVLVATASDTTKAAEVYDPTSGTFTSTGSVLADYDNANAILLPTGKVLLVGPTMVGGPGAELYDPASGRFDAVSVELPPGAATAAGSERYGEETETATMLKDGRILLGILGDLVTYDPQSGSFTLSGSISAPGKWLAPTSTLLSDGRVLFSGGFLLSDDGSTQTATDMAGLYDPVTGFHLISAMASSRAEATATLLPDGTVLMAGGTTDQGSAIASAELFRP
jgi:hypothetical protein